MKYSVISMLIFCLALSGCKNQVKDSQVLQLDMTGRLDYLHTSLNDYVTDIQVIRLETKDSCLIRYFSGYIGEKYIINIEYDKVLLFTSTGKYIRTITRKGKGPGEYTQIDAWTVDKNETFFLFHDIKKDYIYNYNLTSKQFEENIPFKDHGFLSNMILINDTTLSILPGMFTEYGYLFFNQTFSGQITGGIANVNKPHPGAWAGKSPIFKLTRDNSIVFQSSESDTIFRIDGTKMTPIYSLPLEKPQKSGDKTITSSASYLYSDKNRLLIAKSIFESINTPTSASISIKGNEYVSIDFKTLKTSKIDHISWGIMDLSLDSSYYVSSTNNNRIFIAYQASDFKNMLDEAIEREDVTENKKESLRKLNSEISENDNPIVITGKWK